MDAIPYTPPAAPAIPAAISLSAPAAPGIPAAIAQGSPAAPAIPTAIAQSAPAAPAVPLGLLVAIPIQTIWTSAEEIETTTPHGLSPNQRFQVAADVMPGGLTAATWYYAEVLGMFSFKALTEPGGSVVDITSGGSGNRRILRDAAEGAGLVAIPVAIGQSAPAAPAVPTAIAQSAPAAPAIPSAISQSAPAAPEVPEPMVLEGEQPPSAAWVAPEAPVTVAHTVPLTDDQNYRVLVGARAAPVTVTLPDPGGLNQEVEVIDGSLQAAAQPITVDAGEKQIEGQGTTYVMTYNGAVLKIVYTGTNWKII